MKIGPIEKGVPPEKREMYGFAELQIGDSRLFTELEEGRKQKIRAAAWVYARKHGWKIITRQEGACALRVWRLA